MRKLSVITVLVLLSAVFLVSGCAQQEVAVGPTGTDGLVMSFESGMPPAEIYQDDQFDLGVTLENKGSAKVEKNDAAVHIIGFLSSSFTGLSGNKKTLSDALEGVYVEEGKESVAGDSDFLSWNGVRYMVPVSTGTDTITLTAQSCYIYSTTAGAQMCLATKSALRDATGAAKCTPSGEKDVKNSVAPVQVMRVTEQQRGEGFNAEIEIQNVGAGEVYSAIKGTNCLLDQLVRTDKNIVIVSKITLGTQNIIERCNLQGTSASKYVQLRDGVGIITCRVNLTGQLSGTSEAKLNIGLKYGYSETAEASITVLPALTQT